MRVFVLFVGLSVLVAGTLALVGLAIPGVTVSDTFVESFVMEPGQSLRVSGVNGRVTYETWDGEEVVIQATRLTPRFASSLADRIWGKAVVNFTRTDAGVAAVVEAPGRSSIGGNVRFRFDVKAPRGWHGDIELTTSNGPIVASDIHGHVSLRTSNGSITVSGHTGTLQARTSNGPLRLTDVHGTVEARTSNGPLSFLNGTLTESGLLRTSNGAVEMLARLEPGAVYDVQTSNGAVTLTLIDADAALDLSTSNGSINLQTPLTASSIDRRRVVGTVGDGSATLNVRTSNGSITLATVPSD